MRTRAAKVAAAPTKTSPEAGLKLFPLIAGLAVAAACFSLAATSSGFSIVVGPPFTRSSPGELNFWLSHFILGTLGAGLIGYGLSPWLGHQLAIADRRVRAMSPRRWSVGLLLVGILVTIILHYARAYFLLDLPMTDDESGARFGGRVLASGALEIDAPPLVRRLANHYLCYDQAGNVASIDWLGAQIVWALAEVARLGSTLFTLLAAIPIVFVGLLVGRQNGRVVSVAAMVMCFISPMAFTLSMTTHAHVASRALLAVALYIWSVATGTDRNGLHVLLGLCIGGAFLTRPFETLSLLGPLMIWQVVQGARGDRDLLRGASWMLLGLLPAVFLFLVHNWQLTGDPFVPARWAARAAQAAPEVLAGDAAALWNRFGINTSYNLLMLAIWFLGPIGILLVVAGVRSSVFCKLLGLGVVCALLVGLFHEDTGLHSVGPIHYSEAVVPLVIIAANGLVRIRESFGRAGLDPHSWASVFLAVVILGSGTLILWNGIALRKSAHIQEHIYSIVESPEQPLSVVLAPSFGVLWEGIPEFRSAGSWVYGWRHPHPDLRDRVIVVHDRPGEDDAVRAAFPNRAIFRLRRLSEMPYLELTEMR